MASATICKQKRIYNKVNPFKFNGLAPLNLRFPHQVRNDKSFTFEALQSKDRRSLFLF